MPSEDEENAVEFKEDMVICPFACECEEAKCSHRFPHYPVAGECDNEPSNEPNPMEEVATVSPPEPGEAPCVRKFWACRPVKEGGKNET